MHHRFGAFVFLFTVFVGFAYAGVVSAQMPSACIARTDTNDEAQLRADLAACEAEIQKLNVELNSQRQKTGSISKEVGVLSAQIKLKQAEIQKKNKLLSDLSGQIQNRNKKIVSLTEELTREQESLAKMLRKQNLLENYSFTHFLLSGKTVSEFYSDVDTFAYLKSALTESFNTIEKIQKQTEVEKEQLQDKQEEEKVVKQTLEQDKKQVEVKQVEKQQVLTQSKNEEKAYQARLAEKQAHAAKIKQKLFALKGVEGGGLQFGEAYRLAKQAGAKTGIRPAFILAILKQETNLGKNIGTCNRPGTKNWQAVMPGPGESKSGRNDEGAYLALVTALGLDPNSMPLSCPLASGGWGGAMGISQFIPTTWGMYGGFVKSGAEYVYDSSRDRIRTALGSGETSSPWNHLHGITATALYMRDLGASAQTYTAERNAACRYYSGRVCSAPGVTNAFYGNSVMSFAAQIQADIDVLEDAQ